jgi:DtxR family transcriptional regulator, Mn-dependent transcriptional regulator
MFDMYNKIRFPMIKHTWKKISETELQHSSIHYVLAIHELHKEQHYARAIDVANHLGLSRGSVSITLKKLKEKGYVLEDSHKIPSLSEKGKELVNAVQSKRRVLELFFKDVLGISAGIAETDACKIEHLLTMETIARILSFTGLYLSDHSSAIAFRDHFAGHVHHCDQESSSCKVCEHACYFAGRKDLFIP